MHLDGPPRIQPWSHARRTYPRRDKTKLKRSLRKKDGTEKKIENNDKVDQDVKKNEIDKKSEKGKHRKKWLVKNKNKKESRKKTTNKEIKEHRRRKEGRSPRDSGQNMYVYVCVYIYLPRYSSFVPSRPWSFFVLRILLSFSG